MDATHPDLQDLISHIETLGWDDSSQLDSLPMEHPNHESYVLIGKLLAIKTLNTHFVRETSPKLGILLTLWLLRF